MLEVERTWELDEAADLPSFGGDLTAADGGTVSLVATYHDTADLRLARGRVTLRRRTGGKDAGWHLKLPAGRDREELQRPLGRAGAVPVDLRALIRSRTRGEPVGPVVELRTTRHLVVVTDAAGNSAEVADDRVTATRLGAGPDATTAPFVVTWREVEVELLPGADPVVLDTVGAVLAAAGARPSDWQSKLGRALATTPGGAPTDPASVQPVGDVAAVLGYVVEQVGVIVAEDPRVRLHEDDAVHAMRVATRRLRSTLATFGDLWRPVAVDGLAEQLHTLATVLGEVRDREVLVQRFTTSLLALTGPDGESGALLGGRSAAGVAALLVPGTEDADRALVRALDTRGHLRLLDRLVSLSEQDSLVAAGVSADRSVLFALADQPRRVLVRRLRQAHRVEAGTGGHSDAGADEQLHRARRGVKRARYAAEALVPLAGGPARRFVEAHKALAQVLGDHQDAVVARAVLAAHATGPADLAFAAGVLHRDEQLRAAAALAELADVERAAGRRRLRRWLD